MDGKSLFGLKKTDDDDAYLYKNITKLNLMITDHKIGKKLEKL